MTDIPGLIAIGFAAFTATNIDDIFVLMMFFSSSMIFPVKQVVLGQYIGIGLLVAISALGSFISLAVPTYIIALLGIVPIVIGVKKLVVFRKKNESNSKQAVQNKKNNLVFAAVAAVTFSNGGDNIGVYTPLFAKYNSVSQITALATIFMAMTAVWCITAYYLVNHPLVLRRYVVLDISFYLLSSLDLEYTF